MGKTRLATELASPRADGSAGRSSGAHAARPSSRSLTSRSSRRSATTSRARTPTGSPTQLGAARRELAQLFPLLGRDEPDAPVGDPAQAKLRLFEAVVASALADRARARPAPHLRGRPLGRCGHARAARPHRAPPDEHALARARHLPQRRARPPSPAGAAAADLAPLARRGAGHAVTPRAGRGRRDDRRDSRPGRDRAGIPRPDARAHRGKSVRARGDAAERRSTAATSFARRTAGMRGRWRRCGFPRRCATRSCCASHGSIRPKRRSCRPRPSSAGRSTTRRSSPSPALPDATVQSALAIGVAQQMLEEVGSGQATYRWRHALTQEAIADEIVLPRRQEIHGRAADVSRRRRRERAAGCPAPPRRRPLRRGRARLSRRRAGSRGVVRVCRGAGGARTSAPPRPRSARALAAALPDGTRALDGRQDGGGRDCAG